MEKRKEGVFAVRLTGLEACEARRGSGTWGKSENGENDARNTRMKPVRPSGRDQSPGGRFGGTVKTPAAERKLGPDHQQSGDDLNGDSNRPRAKDRVVVQIQPDDAGDQT